MQVFSNSSHTGVFIKLRTVTKLRTLGQLRTDLWLELDKHNDGSPSKR